MKRSINKYGLNDIDLAGMRLIKSQMDSGEIPEVFIIVKRLKKVCTIPITIDFLDMGDGLKDFVLELSDEAFNQKKK